jgi:hypothetical protein
MNTLERFAFFRGILLHALNAHDFASRNRNIQYDFNLVFAVTALLLPADLTPLWWAQVDSNHRPRAYQARALTT